MEVGGDLEEEEKEGRGRRGVLVRAGHGWAFVKGVVLTRRVHSFRRRHVEVG